MNEEDEVNFCALVGARVLEQYGNEDGDDLCFNLLESGVISEAASVSEAAHIVARHLQQM
jgi:hypothetical protein